MQKKGFAVKTLTYSAVFIAMAAALSIVQILKMPMGGSVTACSMMFVAFVGWFFGPRVGLTAAVAYGLLQFLIDPFFMYPLQFLFDYPLAFGCLGVTGFFWQKKHGLVIGYLAGVFGRLVFSVLSGFFFFASYAADAGYDNALLYSVMYNFTYIAPEAVLSVIILSIPMVAETLKKLRASTADI